jgi:hypothetical protein
MPAVQLLSIARLAPASLLSAHLRWQTSGNITATFWLQTIERMFDIIEQCGALMIGNQYKRTMTLGTDT